jgi:UDP-GlcNAc3NAcA epimerase
MKSKSQVIRDLDRIDRRILRMLQADGRMDWRLVHTGQHFDANMSDVFFEELGMHKPDHLLDIHGGRHGAMTGRMLEQVEKVLLNEKPDAVLVYGDTNSTLAGALAAAKLHIPVAHVEAGLRSFNMAMPEEVNQACRPTCA